MNLESKKLFFLYRFGVSWNTSGHEQLAAKSWNIFVGKESLPPPPHAHDAPLACLPALGFASLQGHQSVLPAIGGAPHYWCLKLPSPILLFPFNIYLVFLAIILKSFSESDTLTRSGEESSFWQHWYWQRVFQHWYWRKFLLILTASRRPIKLSAHSQLAGNLEIMHGWKNYQIIKNQWLFWIFPSAFQAKTQAHL